MELPRSRRSAHWPLGRKSESVLPHTTVHVIEEKKFRASVLLAGVILFALVGSSLYYNLFSFSCKIHLDHDQPLTTSFEFAPSTPTISKVLDDRILSTTDEADGAETSEEDLDDYTLGNLLADLSEFEPDTCASRGHHHHRNTSFKPSKELVQKLRKYEVQHRECAGRAKEFHRSDFENQSHAPGDACRYVVWIAYSGLGNRLMTLVSAFLYALLTDRILLVDRSIDMSELFCEPIPRTSWLVPPEITVEWLSNLNESSPRRFGHKFNNANGNSPTADFTYIHLTHTSDDKDQVFFCDSGQEQLDTKPWIFIKSNTYFVPGLFFVSKFRADLGDLFPHKETIFHLLGRYLFHPADAVWGWITRFHKAYLADHDQQVGIQIRTFNDTPLPHFSEQIQQCVRHHDLLPRVITDLDRVRASRTLQLQSLRAPETLTSVLVTSLQPYYYENLRDLYLSGPTEGDESVSVHQPSHEGVQQTDKFGHDLKAWADIYLLSLSDELITSGWSTFGYSAQALAGIKPWILVRSLDGQVPDPPCVQARSIEPCFHTPPTIKCHIAEYENPATILPYVQSCEDVSWGIKLITGPPSQLQDHL